MILAGDKEVRLNKFPDGTFLLKEKPEKRVLLSWYYEREEELVAIIYLAKHYRANGAEVMDLYMPYIPNARQDRVKEEHDVFTLKYFSEVINSLGFDHVVVCDPHSSVSEALFKNLRVLSPENYINTVYDIVRLNKYNEDGNETYMFFPDEGAMKRYSSLMKGCPYTFGIKNRDWATGQIKGLSVEGDVERYVKGKNILIIDDICSRGGTFYHSAKKLKELGANKIFLFVTHCENTILDGDLLKSGLIEKVFTTHSLFSKEHPMVEEI